MASCPPFFHTYTKSSEEILVFLKKFNDYQDNKFWAILKSKMTSQSVDEMTRAIQEMHSSFCCISEEVYLEYFPRYLERNHITGTLVDEFSVLKTQYKHTSYLQYKYAWSYIKDKISAELQQKMEEFFVTEPFINGFDFRHLVVTF
jgi:hypothetical protein